MSASAPRSIRCVGRDHNTWEGTAISSTCLLLSGLNRLCYIFLSVMLFGRMYSDELSQVFMKEQEGKKKDSAVGCSVKGVAFSRNARGLQGFEARSSVLSAAFS